MARSYKNAEKFMNSPACAQTVERLCRDGIIPRADFLEAAAFGRDDAPWRARVRKTTAACGVFFLIACAFFAGLAFLPFLMSTAGWMCAFAAFAGVCVYCFYRGKAGFFETCAAAALICFLIFTPDSALGFDPSPAVQCAQAAFLTAMFAFASGSFPPAVPAIVLLNASLCFAALRFCAPSGRFPFETLLTGIALLNALTLAICEYAKRKGVAVPAFARRAVLACLLAVPFFVAVQGKGASAGFLVFSAVLFSSAWNAYAFICSDAAARRLCATAFCVWLIVVFYLLSPFAHPSDWRAFAAFGLFVSGVTAAGTELCRIFDARDKR